MSRTWKITSLKDGQPVASVEGVSHANAVAAIQDAIDGRDPLARIADRGAVASEQDTGTLAVAA
ncbi:MAG: hypothetical protein U0R71_12510 [Solirubrobacterales bacterium]